MSEEKLEFLERSREFWNPGKTQDWQNMEVDLVIDRREGYYIYDMDGRRLIDVHLNGGTFNIGHRNPELIEVLKAATERFDIGNQKKCSPEKSSARCLDFGAGFGAGYFVHRAQFRGIGIAF